MTFSGSSIGVEVLIPWGGEIFTAIHISATKSNPNVTDIARTTVSGTSEDQKKPEEAMKMQATAAAAIFNGVLDRETCFM
jgi:hypothetical protein